MADQVVTPNTGSKVVAGAQKTAFANAVLKLVKTDFVANVDFDKTTVTEADYTGYAASTIVAFGDVYLDPNGGYSFQSYKEFQPSGTAVGNTIYGYYVEDAGGDVIQVCHFGAPVPMNNTDCFAACLVKFNFQ